MQTRKQICKGKVSTKDDCSSCNRIPLHTTILDNQCSHWSSQDRKSNSVKRISGRTLKPKTIQKDSEQQVKPHSCVPIQAYSTQLASYPNLNYDYSEPPKWSYPALPLPDSKVLLEHNLSQFQQQPDQPPAKTLWQSISMIFEGVSSLILLILSFTLHGANTFSKDVRVLVLSLLLLIWYIFTTAMNSSHSQTFGNASESEPAMKIDSTYLMNKILVVAFKSIFEPSN